MNTDERENIESGDANGSAPRRSDALEEPRDQPASLRAELDEVRRERDALRRSAAQLYARLTQIQIAAWDVERERADNALALARALGHIARTQPLLRTMRDLLDSMQRSKFWQLRNRWFGLKKRLNLTPIGPQPFFVPEVEDLDERWERDLPYQRWLVGHRLRESDAARVQELIPLLPRRPTFSVLVPVYDAAERHLREMLDSVVGQLYPWWELCIADDASPSPHVRKVLDEYAARDERIRVTYRTSNGHIVAASNTALAMATGEFVALLDHDDVLTPDALFEIALAMSGSDADIAYSDEDKIDDEGRRSDPYFKPDWSPDSLLSRNYVSHLGVYRTSLLRELGGFRPGFEGSQDYDLILRASEKTERIVHVPRVLYHWRVHSASTASAREQKSYAHEAAVRALEEALARRGEDARIEANPEVPGIYIPRYRVHRPGRISIIVPTRDHGDDVDRCLRSIFERSTWQDFQVLLVDNGSADRESLRIFRSWQAREPHRVRIVPYGVPFNFSRINNYAVAQTADPYVLFLNNDTEVITRDWLEAMLEQAQRESIGAVGAKLLYEDDTVQHAGVVIGLGGVAGHSHKHFPASAPGYFYTLQTVNNYSAVTAACMMMRREVFERIGGFDEGLAIAFNDVDLCLRICKAGMRNVYLPHVVLYHYESKSRGYEDTPEKMERFLAEQAVMRSRWRTAEVPDPHYNPNLTLLTEDYAIRA